MCVIVRGFVCFINAHYTPHVSVSEFKFSGCRLSVSPSDRQLTRLPTDWRTLPRISPRNLSWNLLLMSMANLPCYHGIVRYLEHRLSWHFVTLRKTVHDVPIIVRITIQWQPRPAQTHCQVFIWSTEAFFSYLETVILQSINIRTLKTAHATSDIIYDHMRKYFMNFKGYVMYQSPPTSA